MFGWRAAVAARQGGDLLWHGWAALLRAHLAAGLPGPGYSWCTKNITLREEGVEKRPGRGGWRWFEYFTSLLDPTEKYIRLFRVISFSIYKSYSKFRSISKQRWLTGLEDLTWTADEETTDWNYSYCTISAFNSHTNPILCLKNTYSVEQRIKIYLLKAWATV